MEELAAFADIVSTTRRWPPYTHLRLGGPADVLIHRARGGAGRRGAALLREAPALACAWQWLQPAGPRRGGAAARCCV